MNILIVCPEVSLFIEEYIKCVLNDKSLFTSIVVMAFIDNGKRLHCEGADIRYYYGEGRTLGLIERHIKYRSLVRDVINKEKAFDIIHFHYVDWSTLIHCNGLLNYGHKVVLSFWGSDIFRAKWWMFKIYKPFLDKAYRINLLTHNMIEVFHTYYQDKYDEKIVELDFGNSNIVTIDEIKDSMTKAECKKFWDVAEDKYFIPIGYSCLPTQQHLKIIDAISNIKAEYKDKIVFVLHFVYDYPDKEEYLSKVKNAMDKSGLNYLVIDKFMNAREVAIFRCASDIFLYAQTTDALSATIIEYLYSGCVMTKPIWLDYSTLEDRNIFYIKYNDFEELGNEFAQVISNFKDYCNEARKNRDIILDLKSWDKLQPYWVDLYR